MTGIPNKDSLGEDEGLDMESYGGIAIYFVAFVALFYVLIILPRKRQDKRHKELLETMNVGDRIVTVGGIKGKVSGVKDDSIMVKINESTEIEILKKGIAYKETED